MNITHNEHHNLYHFSLYMGTERNCYASLAKSTKFSEQLNRKDCLYWFLFLYQIPVYKCLTIEMRERSKQNTAVLSSMKRDNACLPLFLWWAYRSFDTVYNAFTICLGKNALWSIFRTMRMGRPKVPMSLTGPHCLTVLGFIISYVHEHIVQILCKKFRGELSMTMLK